MARIEFDGLEHPVTHEERRADAYQKAMEYMKRPLELPPEDTLFADRPDEELFPHPLKGKVTRNSPGKLLDPGYMLSMLQMRMDVIQDKRLLSNVEKIEEINRQVRCLNEFRERLRSGKLDFSGGIEARNSVEEIQKIAPHLFEKDNLQFSFSKEEVPALIESLSQESSRMSNKIPAMLNRADRIMQMGLQVLRMNRDTLDSYTRMLERMASRQRV